MPYLIDGHNLIGQLPDISLDDPNDEAQLVQKLSGFAARTSKHCVVIFDNGLPGGQSRMSTSAVQVIFAPHHQTADSVMLSRIRAERNPQPWTVVSSDNVVLDAARERRMAVLRSPEFAALLRPPAKPDPKKIDAGEAADVHLSPKEVDEWLKLFADRPKKKKR
ncbi:MAG: NYN domain-containing protein [Burkholderiales bacterium]|nr:NYN domain-containing protein [Anaerolineae bacterium]